MLIKVLSPAGIPPKGKFQISPRMGNLNEKVICFVDNGKPNFDIYLERLEQLLRQRYQLAEVIHIKKGHLGAGKALPPEQVQELANKCHGAIVGSCD